MTHFLKISTIALLLLVSISCKKKKEPTTDPVVTNQQTTTPTTVDENGLYFRVNQKFDGNPFKLDTDFADDFGNKIQFTRANFYLSQPKITLQDNTQVDLTNNYFLGDHNTCLLFIENIGTKSIDSVSVNIGIDDTQNHLDPSNYSADNPLAFQSPSMHWGWTDGYLFIVVEGSVDTDGDDVLDDTFAFHIGTDSYLTNIESNSGLSINTDANAITNINLNINYDLLLTGINLSTDNSTHTLNNPSLASSFRNNFATAITIE